LEKECRLLGAMGYNYNFEKSYRTLGYKYDLKEDCKYLGPMGFFTSVADT
jgi:hypothetical protein